MIESIDLAAELDDIPLSLVPCLLDHKKGKLLEDAVVATFVSF